MFLLIDNYDSFSHILWHYLLLTGNECVVKKNDEITVGQIASLAPSRIIISPGPETPLQAGITMDVIASFYDVIPILGVCLGHQALGMFFGGKLIQVPPMHGKTSEVTQQLKHPLFHNIGERFTVMRYHSLAIDLKGVTDLTSLAETADGTNMAIAHKHFPCIGVQFHPESVGTADGQQLLNNWAAMRF